MKILVAMSGGVDSTVTAYLLKQAGNEVIGVNFNFTDTPVGASSRPSELLSSVSEESATKSPWGTSPLASELLDISEKLGIKIICRDYREEFREKIIKYFVESYQNGLTPNPCAMCNATMKFEKLLQVMREENCDMIATGHYANIDTVGASPIKRFCIRKSTNQQKDQSYMLYRLSQDQLSHIIFPLSNMDKKDVRAIASTLGLQVATKKDSQDVCFLDSVGASSRPSELLSSESEESATKSPWGTSPINYKEFIKRYEFGSNYREKIALGQLTEDEILSRPYFKKGEFVGLDGKVLGFHDGIINYTIGQRKGFNIAFGERKFVVKIDAEKNQVVLGSNDDLMSSDFTIRDVVYSGHEENVIGKKFYAKLRYRHEGTLCEIVRADARKGEQAVLTCHLLSPVRAITPGQSAVFYDDEGRVMFGGIIV